MKSKAIFALVLAACGWAAASGQQKTEWKDRRAWFDIQYVQTARLNDWNDVPYLEKQMPGRFSSNFRLAFNVNPVGGFDLWGGIEWGISYPKHRDRVSGSSFPMTQGKEYYLTDTGKIDGSMNLASLSCGVSYSFKAGDWRISPGLGLAWQYLVAFDYKVTLKEKYSNTVIEQNYYWDGGAVIPCLVPRIQFAWKYDRHNSLLLGLEWRHALKTTDFNMTSTEVYSSLRRTASLPGNRIDVLGVSVGISFR